LNDFGWRDHTSVRTHPSPLTPNSKPTFKQTNFQVLPTLKQELQTETSRPFTFTIVNMLYNMNAIKTEKALDVDCSGCGRRYLNFHDQKMLREVGIISHKGVKGDSKNFCSSECTVNWEKMDYGQYDEDGNYVQVTHVRKLEKDRGPTSEVTSGNISCHNCRRKFGFGMTSSLSAKLYRVADTINSRTLVFCDESCCEDREIKISELESHMTTVRNIISFDRQKGKYLSAICTRLSQVHGFVPSEMPTTLRGATTMQWPSRFDNYSKNKFVVLGNKHDSFPFLEKFVRSIFVRELEDGEESDDECERLYNDDTEDAIFEAVESNITAKQLALKLGM
jgi:hypothetical protein